MTARPLLTLPAIPDRPLGPPPRPGERVVEPPPRPPRPTVNAKRLKVTVVVDPAELAAVSAPDGKPRVKLRIQLPDRRLVADIAAKSIRKAQATISEHGADGVAVILQGVLLGDDSISEAGLSAQPKARAGKEEG